MFMSVQVSLGSSGGPGQQSQEAQFQAFCSQRPAYRCVPQAFQGLYSCQLLLLCYSSSAKNVQTVQMQNLHVGYIYFYIFLTEIAVLIFFCI